MQSIASIGRGIYRIVFRSGSPQRIQYSDRLLLAAVLGFLASTVAAQVFFFRSSTIATGLLLFTVLSGTYIGAALLTRRTPRTRLRSSLQAYLLLLTAAQLLLVLLAPLAGTLADFRPIAAAVVGAAALLGTSNVVHFALASTRAKAVLATLAFAAVLGAFFTIMRSLLETVFS